MGNTITVDFHGDQLLGIENERGRFVYLRPIVERLGLGWSSQLKRVKRDPVLKGGVVIMTTPPAFGGDNRAVFLTLDLFHGWLFKVNASRVRAELRPKLITYQRDGYAALARAFVGKGDASAPTAPLPLPQPPEVLTTPERRKLVAEARQTHGLGAARQLWHDLKLPTVPLMFGGPDLPLFSYEAHRHEPAGGRQ